MALPQLPSRGNVIDDLICKAIRAHAFADPGKAHFSSHSVADIFEVNSSGGSVRASVRNEELLAAIKVSES